MAFDEAMKMASFLKEEEEHHYSLSRLAVCSNYEADDEPSDSDYRRIVGKGKKLIDELDFSDSDKGSIDYQSLPATPPRRRRRRHPTVSSMVFDEKDYASDNETGKEKEGNDSDKNQRRLGRTRPEYPPWVNSMRRSYVDVSGGYGGGVVVVTKPIGGGRPLCMDLGEVKACKDLGFDLEPGRVSYSGSNMDTSSGGNSPNHRISSPGDDPKDVKARLKAWAQAVAFVSTSHRKPPNSL